MSTSVTLDARGGRVTSIRAAGRELLAPDTGDRLLAGCYPMVPWAGRLAEGRLRHEGRDLVFEPNLPPHAAHGLALDLDWEQRSERHVSVSLADVWPLGGRADVTVDTEEHAVRLALSLTATDHSLPAALGWHPCFNRTVGGETAALDFDADRMIVRDGAGLPSPETTTTWQHPVDDCFEGVAVPPVLRWGDLAVELVAPTETWVVFDERDDVICIEPQTAPPDAPNQDRAVVLEPGQTLSLPLTLAWTVR